MGDDLPDDDYRALHDFRYAIRRFLHFSEEAARAAGVEPQQHQLLLAIRAGWAMSVASLAERMQLQHHSAVELIDRAEGRGLVRRHRDDHDRRQVVVSLTTDGERLLRDLSIHHREQLRLQGPELIRALEAIVGIGAPAGTRPALDASQRQERQRMDG